ncbi:PadR family transcriptional regulator [Kribbella sp. NPDC050470]|uniref:PadR family transcriptional regulator n=1 Tax=unclassified Kribbella TaxID=2644121 RepID=UPI0037A703AD
MTRTLNATAASLLGFLHEGPLTGWDLVATAQQRIGDFWSLTQSQVYRELTAMAEAGLVEAGDPGPRARRPYALTDAGRAAFAEWLEGDVTEELIRFPLLLVVMFGRHVPPDRLAEVIATHRHVHAQRLALYEKQLSEPPTGEPDPYAAATLDFGVRYERAVLGWFDALPAVIRGANG